MKGKRKPKEHVTLDQLGPKQPIEPAALSLIMEMAALYARNPIICSTPGCNHAMLPNIAQTARDLMQGGHYGTG